MKTSKKLVVLAALTATTAWLTCLTAQGETVLNNNDSGSGSLRDAILNAGNNEVITFDPSVVGLIVLNGELEIKTNLSIVGPGAKTLALDGLGSRRILHVFPSLTSVSVSGLTLQNGSEPGNPGLGGGVLNESPLSLSQCHITACSATGSTSGANGQGGGIYSSADLAMTACTVSYCHAFGASGSSGSGLGGGLYATASLGLTNCTFTWNEATAGAGLSGGDVEVRNALVDRAIRSN